MADQQLELINTEAHKTLRVDPTFYNTPDNQINACLVLVSELSTLCHEYPIFIVKHPEQEKYQLTALLGLNSGQNLYLAGDQWRAKYLPLDILRKPFQAFVPNPNEPLKGSIAIDVNSPAVGAKGELLFTPDGESTEYFKRVEQTFAQLLGGSRYSSELLQQADDFGLLEAVSLKVDLANGETVNLNGMYQFAKEKVTALSGQALTTCHENGILQVCHLVLSSSIHLDKLIQWHIDT